MLKLRKNKKGFTLVELIVVIAIMAVLAGTVAGVTVSQLNKQTNKSAQSEVDGLMGEFKSFILDYDFGATGATVDTLKAAIDAFNTEAKKTKGQTTDILVATGSPKAGSHQFVYSVEAGAGTGEFEVVFSCSPKGNGSDIEAKYTYSDVLEG